MKTIILCILAILCSSCSANVDLWHQRGQAEALIGLQQRLNAVEGWVAGKIREEQKEKQIEPSTAH